MIHFDLYLKGKADAEREVQALISDAIGRRLTLFDKSPVLQMSLVTAYLSDLERRNAQLEAALANQHRVLEHAALLLELASSTYATHAQRNGMNMLISEYLKRFQHSRNASVIPPVEVDDIPF